MGGHGAEEGPEVGEVALVGGERAEDERVGGGGGGEGEVGGGVVEKGEGFEGVGLKLFEGVEDAGVRWGMNGGGGGDGGGGGGKRLGTEEEVEAAVAEHFSGESVNLGGQMREN